MYNYYLQEKEYGSTISLNIDTDTSNISEKGKNFSRNQLERIVRV